MFDGTTPQSLILGAEMGNSGVLAQGTPYFSPTCNQKKPWEKIPSCQSLVRVVGTRTCNTWPNIRLAVRTQACALTIRPPRRRFSVLAVLLWQWCRIGNNSVLPLSWIDIYHFTQQNKMSRSWQLRPKISSFWDSHAGTFDILGAQNVSVFEGKYPWRHGNHECQDFDIRMQKFLTLLKA